MQVVETKEVRKVREDDIDRVSALEHASFKDPYPTYFLTQLARNNPNTFLVITIDNEVIGYAVAEDWTDHEHLISIAVRPDKRKNGLGKQLMLELEKKLPEGRLFRLEVRQSNKAALRLYEKLGFHRTDLAEGYYTDGEDAIVMEKMLTGQVVVESEA